MKILVASDIHGSYYYLKQLMVQIQKENPDKILLLGDLLYHGPRNELPKEYSPKDVIPLLNGLKEKIICVRGNCDAEVDQMVLDFPILADYTTISLGNITIFATHGHLFSKEKMPPLNKGDIYLQGHTHVPMCEEFMGVTLMNPGSVSIPKENSHHGFITIENGTFLFKDLDGNIIKTFEI